MTTDDQSSTVPRRQLGRELRKAREVAGLTVEAAAAALEWSRPKLWRIEKGTIGMRTLDVKNMCELYGVPKKMRDALMSLAPETRQVAWYHAYSQVPRWFELYIGLEGAAEKIQQYAVELVPGLLQTKDYARAVLLTAPNGGSTDVDQLVEVRLGRQSRLTDKGMSLDLILNEAILRRPVGGPAVMAEQLGNLVSMSELPNVQIRVLQFSAGEHAAMLGSFVILSFPQNMEPQTVYQDGANGAIYHEKPGEVERYKQQFESIDKVALDRYRSHDLIASAAREYESVV
ncbi:helix-turn-helix transcriptional regulator [Fodinicola feengrottensis]|uniref:Helix-turn-helix transcriptional regulator n=1 Tax=Fodinicola feengrottensis TaxID=435914 RepID=A0ABN2G393_9ACTN